MMSKNEDDFNSSIKSKSYVWVNKEKWSIQAHKHTQNKLYWPHMSLRTEKKE